MGRVTSHIWNGKSNMFETTNQHEEETVVFSRNLASRWLDIIDSFASYLGLSKDEAFSTQDTMSQGKCGSRVFFGRENSDKIWKQRGMTGVLRTECPPLWLSCTYTWNYSRSEKNHIPRFCRFPKCGKICHHRIKTSHLKQRRKKVGIGCPTSAKRSQRTNLKSLKITPRTH